MNRVEKLIVCNVSDTKYIFIITANVHIICLLYEYNDTLVFYILFSGDLNILIILHETITTM